MTGRRISQYTTPVWCWTPGGHWVLHDIKEQKEYSPTVETRAPCATERLCFQTQHLAQISQQPVPRVTVGGSEGSRLYSFTYRDKEVLQISSKAPLYASVIPSFMQQSLWQLQLGTSHTARHDHSGSGLRLRLLDMYGDDTGFVAMQPSQGSSYFLAFAPVLLFPDLKQGVCADQVVKSMLVVIWQDYIWVFCRHRPPLFCNCEHKMSVVLDAEWLSEVQRMTKLTVRIIWRFLSHWPDHFSDQQEGKKG